MQYVYIIMCGTRLTVLNYYIVPLLNVVLQLMRRERRQLQYP